MPRKTPRKVEVKRRFEVLRWIEVPMSAVRKGDRLRAFEPNNEPVRLPNGDTEFTVHSNARKGRDGLYTVKLEVDEMFRDRKKMICAKDILPRGGECQCGTCKPQ